MTFAHKTKNKLAICTKNRKKIAIYTEKQK